MTDLSTVFNWTEAYYEADVTADAMRREIDRKLAAVRKGAEALAADLRSGTVHTEPSDADAVRSDLAHLLANLNSAELHVSDYLGS